MANLGQISFIFIYSQFNDKFNWQIVVSGADVIFLEYHSMLHLIKVLWLAVANHMTSFNQLNCLISTYLSCATLKFAYDISSKKAKSLSIDVVLGSDKELSSTWHQPGLPWMIHLIAIKTSPIPSIAWIHFQKCTF